MRIILVEDDPGIRDALQIVFEREGFIITAYRDGTDILEDRIETPDAFLIDKRLPGVDGLDICRHIKGSPGIKDIPVLIMSASPAIERLALDAGADAFIEKPFSNRDLIIQLRKLTNTT